MRIQQIFTVLSAVMILVLTACKTSPKEVLVGKWKAIEVTGSMADAGMKKQIVGEGNNTLEFLNDGTYISRMNGKEDDKGTYTLSEDGKRLTAKPAKGGPEQNLTLKELTKNKMIADMGIIVITFEPSK